MKRMLLALALLPGLAFAVPTTFTVAYDAYNIVGDPVPRIAGQIKFTFDDSKQPVVNFLEPSYSVVYNNQPSFVSNLNVLDNVFNRIEGDSSRAFFASPPDTVVSANSASNSVDTNGNVNVIITSIRTQSFSSATFPSLTPSDIVKYFETSPTLDFRTYSYSFSSLTATVPPSPYQYYYVDSGAKLISVSSEGEVPEPATLATSLLGLGLIGFMRKRRKYGRLKKKNHALTRRCHSKIGREVLPQLCTPSEVLFLSQAGVGSL